MKPEFDLVFTIVNNMFLIIIFLAVLYPLVYVFSASFSDPIAVSSGKVWLWPVQFTTESLRAHL